MPDQDSSDLSVFESFWGAPRSYQSHDPSAIWRCPGLLRSHDPSCVSVFGGFSGSSATSSWRVLEALGGSRTLQHQGSSALSVSSNLSGGPSKFPKSRSIGLVGVWEAHNSRSVVPVGVWRLPGMLRSHDLSCLSVFGGLPDGFLTCSGAPQASLVGSWRLLGALGACKIKIHRPCRCLGGSQVTICRACRCLEASRRARKS